MEHIAAILPFVIRQAPPTHVQQSQQWQQQQQQQPQQLQQMPELTKQQQQQLTKQRQHEEQKRKFKHFHVNGAGRSLDATSLIDSMITRPTPSQPVTTKPPPPNNTGGSFRVRSAIFFGNYPFDFFHTAHLFILSQMFSYSGQAVPDNYIYTIYKFVHFVSCSTNL